jgi:ATP-dependent Lhr-like helicase
VRGFLADPFEWDRLPAQTVEWLRQQRRRSVLPGKGDLLVETFARSGRFYLVAYPFEGRLAHQTLGMLLTRRLERAGLKPLGFVANDYGLAAYACATSARGRAASPASSTRSSPRTCSATTWRTGSTSRR